MKKLYSYHNNKTELIQQILERRNSIKVPENTPKKLIETYQICRVLDDYLIDYFSDSLDSPFLLDIHREIDQIMANFKKEVLEGLGNEKQKFREISQKSKKRFKNIFECSGSENLY